MTFIPTTKRFPVEYFSSTCSPPPLCVCQEGVKFRSPHDDTEMLLTPEHSVEIQNTIGADIIMQLDDVVHSTTTGPRVEEAMWRTVRWLDRYQ